MGGIAHTAVGIRQLADRQYVDGVLNTSGGLSDAAHSVAEVAGKAPAAKVLEKAGPILDGASAINNSRKGQYADGMEWTLE